MKILTKLNTSFGKKFTLGRKEILPLALIIIIFIISFVAYSYLPEKIPSHWNSRGEIDSYASKNFVVWFFPVLILVIYLLMTFLPLIDPLRKNYSKFSNVYFWLRTFFVIFFIFLYFYSLWAAIGPRVNINYFIVPVISIFFILLGIFMPKIKKNYFVGIRTPWTIHDEKVWNKTHKFSGKLFIGAGVVSFLGIIVPNFAFAIFLISILSAAFGSIVYSYFAFRKIIKNEA